MNILHNIFSLRMKGGYLNDRGQNEKSPWSEIFEIFEIVEFLYDQILKQ